MKHAIRLIEKLLYGEQDERLENWMLLDMLAKDACSLKGVPQFDCPSHDGAKKGAACCGQPFRDPWKDVARRLHD